MNNKAIEMLMRMHSEKTPSMQRGAGVLTGDVIIGAIGVVQHLNPFGSDLMMAKWLKDRAAIIRVEQRAVNYADNSKSKRPDLMKNVAITAVEVFVGRPTADLNSKIVNLWQHSAEGQRSKRLIKKYKVQIANLKNQTYQSEFQLEQADREIDYFEDLIENERARMRRWSERKARESYICPACRGSGKNSNNTDCPHCRGTGYFTPNSTNIKKHLLKSGVRISQKLWDTDLKPRLDELSGLMQREHDEAANQLSKRLKLEANEL